jgi:hypothetical protein
MRTTMTTTDLVLGPRYIHEDRKTYGASCVVRWVVTHYSARTSCRSLTLQAQGRETFGTCKDATAWLGLASASLRNVLDEDEHASLAVFPVLCWPGHHDPVRTVFPDFPSPGDGSWCTCERERDCALSPHCTEIPRP